MFFVSVDCRSSNHDSKYVLVSKTYGMRSHHGSILTRIFSNVSVVVIAAALDAIQSIPMPQRTTSLLRWKRWALTHSLTHSFTHSICVDLSATSINVCLCVCKRKRHMVHVIRSLHVLCFQQTFIDSKQVCHSICRASFTPPFMPHIHSFCFSLFLSLIIFIRSCFVDVVCAIRMYHVIYRIQCDLINVLMTNLFEWIYVSRALLRLFHSFRCPTAIIVIIAIIWHFWAVVLGGVNPEKRNNRERRRGKVLGLWFHRVCLNENTIFIKL